MVFGSPRFQRASGSAAILAESLGLSGRPSEIRLLGNPSVSQRLTARGAAEPQLPEVLCKVPHAMNTKTI